MPESKRKVSGDRVTVEELDDRNSKRRKVPVEYQNKKETPETTRFEGIKALDHIKKIVDKTGRIVVDPFLKLPTKREAPDYYQVTKLPLAINTIEAKLKQLEYPTLTAFEADFKRMILNAKQYNEKGSGIFEDAERLRKGFSNYMTHVNPAYKTAGFTVTPTPLPTDEEAQSKAESHEPEEKITEAPAEPIVKKRGRPSKNASARSSATPSFSDSIYGGRDFSGLTFQQAQEKIVEDMIQYKEDPDDEYRAFEVFVELPPKSLKDYYAVIQDPRSLETLWKQVRGMSIDEKKSESTGVSRFAHWDDFEREANIIWANACHYNEDGSEIFELAKELETFFYKDLEKAKKAVPGPKKTILKITNNKPVQTPQAPKIMLKMATGNKASPAPAATTNGDSPAPVGRRNPFGGSVVAATPTTLPNLDQLDRARSISGSVASPTTSNTGAVKHEDGVKASPAITARPEYGQTVSSTNLNGTGMPPPLTPGLSQTSNQAGYSQSFNHQMQYQVPKPAFESKFRQPGKTASDAMITNLSIATHIGLNIKKHFRMEIPPSDTMTQQSVTINLPASHYYLQVKPTIAASLLERQHKLFFTLNTQRLHAMPLEPGQAVDPRHPLFEGRLNPGVNRLELEVIAALPKGTAKPPTGQDIELEKITVFANLLRAP